MAESKSVDIFDIFPALMGPRETRCEPEGQPWTSEARIRYDVDGAFLDEFSDTHTWRMTLMCPDRNLVRGHNYRYGQRVRVQLQEYHSAIYARRPFWSRVKERVSSYYNPSLEVIGIEALVESH